jgi:hypothetical protein
MNELILYVENEVRDRPKRNREEKGSWLAGAEPACGRIARMLSMDEQAAHDTAVARDAATTATKVAEVAAGYARDGIVPESYKQLEATNAAKAAAAFEAAKASEALVRDTIQRQTEELRRKPGFQNALLTGICLFHKDPRFVISANQIITRVARPPLVASAGAPSGGAGRPRKNSRRI